MSLAVVHARAQVGIEAPAVRVEVHLSGGLPRLCMVGLPETTVRESRDRVRAALINSGFEFPLRRITISLAPADLPKDGGRFDLAIALGILAASNQIPDSVLTGYEFVGELSLAGELQPVNGIIPTALACRKQQRQLLIPTDNGAEAHLLEADHIRCADSLLTVTAYLLGQRELPAPWADSTDTGADSDGPDIAVVRGQQQAIRALVVAACGKHNLLFRGPPGSGKTLLANCLPGLLPDLDRQEALESLAITSVAGRHTSRSIFRPVFRSPHHTTSAVALVGGGSKPRPGEISLAHRGVLFLDELPEYPRHVLEALREPLESGEISISRAARQAIYPARFQLIAAMNPCPCGYAGDPRGNCHCTREQVNRYLQRISGPLLDRIDLHVEVSRLPLREMRIRHPVRPQTPAWRERIRDLRQLQRRRQDCNNAELDRQQVETICRLNKKDEDFVIQACEQLNLSARAYTRILRMARSIADLEQQNDIQRDHLAEALAYRRPAARQADHC